MNKHRDPLLETLFAQAERELVEDEFTAKVMAQVAKRRRNVLFGQLAFVGLFVALEYLLSTPLQHSAGVFAQVLNTSLVKLDSGAIAIVIAPINSIAGLIGILLLGLQYLHRRMVR